MIHESWGEELIELAENKKKDLISLGEKFLPAEKNIFKALEKPFQDVKVLIIGQDPYPLKKNKERKDDIEHAHGLAFSSLSKDTPASLKNIFKELGNEYKLESNNLTSWADQGVMLLNRALTYESKNKTNEHIKFWKEVIDKTIEKLLNKEEPLVVMLWGKEANDLIPTVPKDKKNILILRASHPSPLSFYHKPKKFDGDPFEKCQHFSRCNEFLGVDNQIDWST